LRFVFSLLPFREVRRSADGGGDLFLAPGGGQRLSSPEAILADSLAIFRENSRLEVIEVGERSVAQKLKLVFYSDDG